MPFADRPTPARLALLPASVACGAQLGLRRPPYTPNQASSGAVASVDARPSFERQLQRSLFVSAADVDRRWRPRCGAGRRERAAAHRAQERRRIEQLELACDGLCERVVTRERELAELRAELGRLREEGERGMRALAGLASELKDVRRQARGQATRIRLRALREAADLGGRMTELARRPESRERLLDSLQTAIARIGAEEEGGGDLDVERAGAASPDELFDGMVEIEVGPLADFSQLVGFEDAAGGIVATSEISVKRFARGRATLEMKLIEPVELLRELEERSPFEFRVRDRRRDRLVLDVDEAEAA